MSLHLIKLCVGVENVDHLIRIHKTRMAGALNNDPVPVIRHITRNKPRRTTELLQGGSLYWVIRRNVIVRQPIIGIESLEREDGRSACAIVLSHSYIRTVPRQTRAFQGWRYLEGQDVPDDLGGNEVGETEDLPLSMSAELKELGLL